MPGRTDVNSRATCFGGKNGTVFILLVGKREDALGDKARARREPVPKQVLLSHFPVYTKDRKQFKRSLRAAVIGTYVPFNSG